MLIVSYTEMIVSLLLGGPTYKLDQNQIKQINLGYLGLVMIQLPGEGLGVISVIQRPPGLPPASQLGASRGLSKFRAGAEIHPSFHLPENKFT